MWKNKIEKIKAEKETYSEETNGGATDDQINIFKENVRVGLQIELPNEYLNTIKYINGLIELNQIWYENEEQKKYLFLGESNISWYVFDLQQKKYKELDNPSGQEMEIFNHFEEMYDKLLTDALQ